MDQVKPIYRRVEPKDIAPTLFAIVGNRYPSGSTGNPLLEVMDATQEWQVAPPISAAAKKVR